MNKLEFLQQLEQELGSVSTDERVAALQYFTMYFEDAGPEHEAEVIAELGSPQKIAADIRASSGGENGESWTPPVKPAERVEQKAPEAAAADAAQTGPAPAPAADTPFGALGQPPAAPVPPVYQTPPAQGGGQAPPVLPPGGAYTGTAGAGGGAAALAATASSAEKDRNRILLIILLVCTLPLWGSLLAALLSLICAAIVLLAVPVIVGGSFTIGAIAVLVSGLVILPIHLGGALFNIGVSLVLGALGISVFALGISLLKKVVPAMFRFVSSIIKSIFK